MVHLIKTIFSLLVLAGFLFYINLFLEARGYDLSDQTNKNIILFGLAIVGVALFWNYCCV